MDQRTLQELSFSGRHQECLQFCQKLLQRDLENPLPWKFAGKSLFALGQFEKAQEYLKKAHQIDKKDPEIIKDIGNTFEALHNHVEAIKMYQAALSINQYYAPAINNLGLIAKHQNKLTAAEKLVKRACDLDQSFGPYHLNLSIIYKDLGKLEKALESNLKALELMPNNPNALINLGAIYLDQGNLDQALDSNLKALEIMPDHPNGLMNLGAIYKALGNPTKALQSTLNALKIIPDNPNTLITLGAIYKDLGNLNKALYSTLKALEIMPDHPNALINLGTIYLDLGNLDKALDSNLKALELNPKDPTAIRNIKDFIEELNISTSNVSNITRAYELLLNQTDISHKNLSRIFLQAFLPIIQKASSSDPIISDSNQAFKVIAADWRLRKSLTLIIPPSSEVEEFFTKLRKELLILTAKKGTVPQQLKPLTEALAAQCFLNEYVYTSSKEEDDSIAKLIDAAVNSKEATNRYLPIIGCYTAIHTTGISPEFINNYPTPDESSKELIATQFKEPLLEQEIKTSFQEKSNITDKTSQRVQDMYEDNPYPRFRYCDYKPSKLAQPIYKVIENEATRKDLSFSEELKSLATTPTVLIAGCGTGKQAIDASRYKRVQITAIDLSSSSLAYAIRKTKEYKMNNITYKQIDILNISDLGATFDVIECGGVLHHMEKPDDGLSALVQQLKPGGYIKLGLYSETARKKIVEARRIIQKLEIDSTPESIREFRKQVIDGKIQELLDLPKSIHDFHSLSECRDLCFHVQEHRYTIEKLQKLLDSHDLTFCGFMVPEHIKKLYREQYPEDSDMTSLVNWGEFEEQHPSTFLGMYQFWNKKPS